MRSCRRPNSLRARRSSRKRRASPSMRSTAGRRTQCTDHDFHKGGKRMTPTTPGHTLRLTLGALLAVASFASAAQTAAIEQRLEKALKDLGFADGKLPAL